MNNAINAELSYGNDYTQSANTLFHFMPDFLFLKRALQRKWISPRYCKEDVQYLNLQNGERVIDVVAVLQKCFCDIPLHMLPQRFKTIEINEGDKEDNKEKQLTHSELYGSYAIALSKQWGVKHNLQPVHYINPESSYCHDFSEVFNEIMKMPDSPDRISNDMINRIGYLKPLHGVMERKTEDVNIQYLKNFHDEKEWRYVPDIAAQERYKISSIIVNKNIINEINHFSDSYETEKYQELWLHFNYDDIRYLIVPSLNDRIELIRTIHQIPDALFDYINPDIERGVLISKILVMNEIVEDV